MSVSFLLRAAAAVLMLSSFGAGAQAQQSTSATYDDWVLNCQTEAAPTAHKVCQISQISRIKENNQPFSRVAMSRPAGGAPAVFVAQLPVNVLTQAPVGMRLDDADPGLSAPFVRCIPAGCFVEFELKDDLLKKFRAAEGEGKLTFKDAAGHDLVVPVSMKGFRAAYDALPKD